jgi:hypothetical protein
MVARFYSREKWNFPYRFSTSWVFQAAGGMSTDRDTKEEKK